MSDFDIQKDNGKMLEGRELELAKEFVTCLEMMNAETEEIQRKCNAEALIVREQYIARAKVAWFEIMHRNGVDAEKAWGNRAWFVDVQYMNDHGCAFLRKNLHEEMGDLWKETLLPPLKERH